MRLGRRRVVLLSMIAVFFSLAASANADDRFVIDGPGLVDFGSLVIGGPSRSQQFTITYVGWSGSRVEATVGLHGSQTFVNSFSVTADNCPAYFDHHGESCTATVRFAPTVAGRVTGDFEVSDLFGATFVLLLGTGVVPAGLGGAPGSLLVASPAGPIDFGALVIRPAAPTRPVTVTVTNTGSAGEDVTIEGVTIDDPEVEGPFGFSHDGCSGVTLAGGDSCTFTLVFCPCQPGPAMGTATVTADDGETLTIDLTGLGLAPTPPPGPTPTPVPIPPATPTANPATPTHLLPVAPLVGIVDAGSPLLLHEGARRRFTLVFTTGGTVTVTVTIETGGGRVLWRQALGSVDAGRHRLRLPAGVLAGLRQGRFFVVVGAAPGSTSARRQLGVGAPLVRFARSSLRLHTDTAKPRVVGYTTTSRARVAIRLLRPDGTILTRFRARTRPAGRHQLVLRSRLIASLAPGSYRLRLRATGADEQQRVSLTVTVAG